MYTIPPVTHKAGEKGFGSKVIQNNPQATSSLFSVCLLCRLQSVLLKNSACLITCYSRAKVHSKKDRRVKRISGTFFPV